ncbi:SDH family Clp fold serine proteinase [Candidatus Palauibacter sp.]|uniref:SDH family Clp fold serine proteinase n=1 Tax=Candidatus Palauibacter sp. TaxID=3101350 RepID=UPI003B59E8FA
MRSVLIPFRANSAGTLIALGADRIVLTDEGELGPIDPKLDIRRMVQAPDSQGTFVQDTISVEDVMAYVRFVGEQGASRTKAPSRKR